MHFTQYDSSKHDVSLAKRESIRKYIHKEIFNEDVDLDKMKRGDETFVFSPVVFVDSFFHKDSKYYILHSPSTDGFFTVSKEIEEIPEEAYTLAEKVFEKSAPKLFEEIDAYNDMNSEDEDDNQGS